MMTHCFSSSVLEPRATLCATDTTMASRWWELLALRARANFSPQEPVRDSRCAGWPARQWFSRTDVYMNAFVWRRLHLSTPPSSSRCPYRTSRFVPTTISIWPFCARSALNGGGGRRRPQRSALDWSRLARLEGVRAASGFLFGNRPPPVPSKTQTQTLRLVLREVFPAPNAKARCS